MGKVLAIGLAIILITHIPIAVIADDSQSGESQTQDIRTWEWVEQVGDSIYGSIVGKAIAVDSDGNAYVTGYFNGIASFGSQISLTSSGDYDIFVAKLDNNNTWVWATQAGGSHDDRGQDIAIDLSGNIYVTGRSASDATFGSLNQLPDGSDFVAKLDNSGNWQWVVRCSGCYSSSQGITIDTNANIYFTGNLRENITFGPIILSSPDTDIYVTKLNSSGVWQWAVKAGGTSWDYAYGISSDTFGNTYVTGKFRGEITFGSINLTSNGSSDIFVAKIDSNGMWQWAVKAGGTGPDLANGIAVDSSGNSYVTGFFEGIANFGSINLTSNGYNDIFVFKLDTNGTWQWAVRTGGDWHDLTDSGRGIAVDLDGNTYVTGRFVMNATFGLTTLTNETHKDLFVAKLDNMGNWEWAIQGGDNFTISDGIAVDSGGNTYVTGRMEVPQSSWKYTLVIAKISGDSDGVVEPEPEIKGDSMPSFEFILCIIATLGATLFVSRRD
jgi:hypothetical protein